MITRNQRDTLSKQPMPSGCIGYDCEGKQIKVGDTVEVVVEDEARKGKPEYAFCSEGCRGTAQMHGIGGSQSWFISVYFDRPGDIGCIDYHMRVVS